MAELDVTTAIAAHAAWEAADTVDRSTVLSRHHSDELLKEMEKRYITDCKEYLSKMMQLEKDLRVKRRWLMGLDLPQLEQERLEAPKPTNDKYVPESVLREDDLNYESIRTFVEKTLGVHKPESVDHVDEDEIQIFDSPKNLKYIFSLLDGMTSKGLFRFAEVVTDGSVNFHKTKEKMKKIIKEYLPKLLECLDEHSQTKLKELAGLLKDPQNFCQDGMVLLNPSQSFRAAAIDVLAELEELSFLTLSAMHRNLSGVKGYTPKWNSKRHGWSVKALIKQIRKKSTEMLQEFFDGDEPPEPLAKALAVAQLMLKPKSRIVLPNVSSDIEALQTDIAKAIEVVNDKGKISSLELTRLQLMLDPDSEPSKQSHRLRNILNNFLTEYLLECSNMDTIPKNLLETVRMINMKSERSACRTFSAEEIDEEVNCLLHVSAQAKQIVWDFFPENEFDEDFADAYMEDFEESCDESCYYDDINVSGDPSCSSKHDDLDCQSESVGETSPVDSKLPGSSSQVESLTPLFSPNRKLSIKLESMHITEKDLVKSCAFPQSGSTGQQGQADSHISMRTEKDGFSTISISSGESGRSRDGPKEPKTEPGNMPNFSSSNFSLADNAVVNEKKSNFENRYLVIQEACDETSMFAYSFVDNMLNELAKLDRPEMPQGLQANASGLKKSKEPRRRRKAFQEDDLGSIMINVLEELVPSFPSREKEELRIMLGI